MTEVLSALIERDQVTVSGPDAASFLQGQLSQDILSLADGASAWSFLLSPQGRIDALVRVLRTAPESFALDTDFGYGEAVEARLKRFLLRTRCDLSVSPCWVHLGPSVVTGVPLVSGFDRGVETLLTPDEGDRRADALDPGDAGSKSELELLRLRSMFPAMGSEIDERTIPAETGWVERAVSFTKGCFTGQELVARMDSRGNNAPRRLRLMELVGHANPGDELRDDGGEPVGQVTSATWSESDDCAIALGYLKRSVSGDAPVWGPDYKGRIVG